MRWLLWKEYRQNRLIVFVTLGVLIVPYLIAVYATWIGDSRTQPRGELWAVNFAEASFFSLVLAQVALALIGGNVIAGERVDRSAEFQAYLPIARSKILTAKLLLALAIAAMIWLPNGVLLWTVTDASGVAYRREPGLLEWVAGIATTGLTFFCIAWFFSSILRSATFSVCAGLLSPLFLVYTFLYIMYLFGIKPDPFVKHFYFSTCLTLSPLCFVMGVWLYLRRVEP